MEGALRDVTKVTDIRYRAFKAICKIQIAGKRYPFDAKMPYRCVAAGCSSTASPGIALYKFPNDPVLRKQWERQVQRTRAKWTATESSVLCSKHFTAECFEESAALASQFGISYKRSRRLVRGAVPTIFFVLPPWRPLRKRITGRRRARVIAREQRLNRALAKGQQLNCQK